MSLARHFVVIGTLRKGGLPAGFPAGDLAVNGVRNVMYDPPAIANLPANDISGSNTIGGRLSGWAGSPPPLPHIIDPRRPRQPLPAWFNQGPF